MIESSVAVPFFVADGWADDEDGLGQVTDVAAAWAVEQNTLLVQVARLVRDDSPEVIARTLVEARERAVLFHGLAHAEASAWAVLYACVRDVGARLRLMALVHDCSSREAREEMARWRKVGALGPLAFAAGLTADEAMEQADAGTLDAAGLAGLAALRGWVFPSLP